MSTSTQPAAPAALPEQAGTSAALHERLTPNGQPDGHPDGQAPKTSSGHDRWQVVMVPVERIDPNPWQPRTLFDPNEMEELTQSVKASGVQQPVIVRTAKSKEENGVKAKGRQKKAPQRFQLVAGERRLRASVNAGRKTIPAIVRDDLSDLQVAEMALLENVQRSNLSVIEEARGYKRLMLDFRLSEERLAKKVGKSVAVLREMMKLLALPEGVQSFIRLRKLTAAHGHELLKLAASPDACNSVAAHAVNALLPATALAKDPLPNSRELEKRGLIVPLDYRTRFDKSQCKTCPHKAYVGIGFNAYSAYCLRPDEWKRKQDEVLEREKDESARVLEEARRQSESQADSQSQREHEEGETEDLENGPKISVLNQLPRSSYRDLRFGDLAPGCTSACSCRGCALDPHASAEPQAVGEEESGNENEKGVRVAVCLNPARYAELQREERVRRDEERRRHFTDRFERALHLLHGAWEEGRCAQAVALAFTPFLDGRCARGAYMGPDQWQAMLRRVAEQLDMRLPFERLFEDSTQDGDILRALSQQDIEEEGEEEAFEPLQLVLLGAGVLLALEAEGASRYGGETPMLDFVLPPDKNAQTTLSLGEEADNEDEPDGEEWDEDPYMEEDFGAASQDASESEEAHQDPDFAAAVAGEAYAASE